MYRLATKRPEKTSRSKPEHEFLETQKTTPALIYSAVLRPSVENLTDFPLTTSHVQKFLFTGRDTMYSVKNRNQVVMSFFNRSFCYMQYDRLSQ